MEIPYRHRSSILAGIWIPVNDVIPMEIEHQYTRETFFKSLCEVARHGWFKKHKLMVDITLRPSVIPGEPQYIRIEKWTDAHDDEICSKGYKLAKGLHDSIIWSGVKIYVRIHNAGPSN